MEMKLLGERGFGRSACIISFVEKNWCQAKDTAAVALSSSQPGQGTSLAANLKVAGQVGRFASAPLVRLASMPAASTWTFETPAIVTVSGMEVSPLRQGAPDRTC